MLWPVAVAWLMAGASAAFELPFVSLKDLQDPSEAVLSEIRHAITKVGMFAVGGLPSSAEHGTALQELTRCVHGGHAAGLSAEVVLPDATLRTTIATATNESRRLPFDEQLALRCPGFVRAADHLRAAAAATGHAYAQVLDHLSLGQAAESGGTVDPSAATMAVHPPRRRQEEALAAAVPPQEDTPDADRFAQVVTSAESLEHFHVYRRLVGGPPGREPTLRLHSDMGLFLVMTPPQHFDLESADAAPGAHGFLLQLPNRELVSPVFPAGALLVMNGEGTAHWIRSSIADSVFAPPHEVVVPELGGLGRAWYGRMFLPHRSTRIRGGDTTFNEYWAHSREAVLRGDGTGMPAAGCSPHHRFLAEAGTCSAGYLYCWMTCMSTKSLSCSPAATQPVCKDSVSGKLWPQDFPNGSHCTTCAPQCPASKTVEPPAAAFCNTNLTASIMWMTGFQTAGDATQPCAALFVSQWVLGSAGAFAGACVGVFLMAVAVEAVAWYRRGVVRRFARSRPAGRWHAIARGLATVALYGLQVTLGYFLMLVAMMYQTEFFILLILGLVVGHALFNIRAPVTESADPCCAGQDAKTYPDPITLTGTPRAAGVVNGPDPFAD